MEIEGLRIVPYTDENHPMWFVCFILSQDEQYDDIAEEVEGMSSLILMLMEDRAKLARFIAKSKYYEVIICLREGPCTLNRLKRHYS